MSNYIIQPGDTFEIIARRVYGLPELSDYIARANPGAFEPLNPGGSITLPPDVGVPESRPHAAPANDPDEVAILIDGSRFRFWEAAEITRAIDAPDKITLGGPFEPSDFTHREILRPFSFKPIAATIGGDRIFSGTALSAVPRTDPKVRVFTLRGYALPGVLNDCTPPASSYPLEFNGQDLRAISQTLASPFGLKVVFDDDPGAVFERVAMRPGQLVASFLADLAKQRGLVMGSSEKGELRFKKVSDPGEPVAILTEGAAPVVTIEPRFQDQNYYSHITGIEPSIAGIQGRQYTVKNSRYNAGNLRPLTFQVDDTLGADVAGAVQSKMGRMFGNMVAYTVTLSTWRDPLGALWTPGSAVTLDAPGAMVYRKTKLLIRAVTFSKSSGEKLARLNLVLPGSFSGEIPEFLPWEE